MVTRKRDIRQARKQAEAEKFVWTGELVLDGGLEEDEDPELFEVDEPEQKE